MRKEDIVAVEVGGRLAVCPKLKGQVLKMLRGEKIAMQLETDWSQR